MATRARGNGRSSLGVPMIVLTATAAAAGAAVFAVIAAAGAAFPSVSRGLFAAAASLALIAAAARGPRPWQRDAETPTEWLEREGLTVAVRNGLALGAGFLTRVGFWIWWVLPVLAFESGSVQAGAIVGAAYGAARLGASSFVAARAEATRSDRLPRKLLLWRPRATAAADPLFFIASGVALALAARLVGFDGWR
ncbi:MAG: hypothetical protein E6G22_12355 [Actinobacteria bacterium]|nr:MAG: hypothetical protein E6G22_12355 [Actinomycetota bacterium]